MPRIEIEFVADPNLFYTFGSFLYPGKRKPDNIILFPSTNKGEVRMAKSKNKPKKSVKKVKKVVKSVKKARK